MIVKNNYMKIQINIKQYKTIIKALETSSFIYGPMSDCVDKKYAKNNTEIETVLEDLLLYAKDFNFEDNVEEFDNKPVLNEKYCKKILDDISEYDDWQLCENLASKLAWRDFLNTFSKEEIEKIGSKNSGYFGVELYDFEKKYYDEFNTYEYNRMFIVKNS